jgi:hypothetical protein
MAPRVSIFDYSDYFVDEQVQPNVLHVTANYLARDSAIGKGMRGACPLELSLADSDNQMIDKIKTAVRQHIVTSEGRPELQPVDNTQVKAVLLG